MRTTLLICLLAGVSWLKPVISNLLRFLYQLQTQCLILISGYKVLVFMHHIGNISGYSNTTDVNSCSWNTACMVLLTLEYNQM